MRPNIPPCEMVMVMIAPSPPLPMCGYHGVPCDEHGNHEREREPYTGWAPRDWGGMTRAEHLDDLRFQNEFVRHCVQECRRALRQKHRGTP